MVSIYQNPKKHLSMRCGLQIWHCFTSRISPAFFYVCGFLSQNKRGRVSNFCPSPVSLPSTYDIGTSILQLYKERWHCSCFNLPWPLLFDLGLQIAKKSSKCVLRHFCSKTRSNLTMFCSPQATPILHNEYDKYPMYSVVLLSHNSQRIVACSVLSWLFLRIWLLCPTLRRQYLRQGKPVVDDMRCVPYTSQLHDATNNFLLFPSFPGLLFGPNRQIFENCETQQWFAHCGSSVLNRMIFEACSVLLVSLLKTNHQSSRTVHTIQGSCAVACRSQNSKITEQWSVRLCPSSITLSTYDL